MIQAALFDFDGVLFDTEKQHEIAWRHVALHGDRRITREQFLRGFGLKNGVFIREVLMWSQDEEEIASISLAKERFFQEYILRNQLTPIHGSIDLLLRLYDNCIPCVIGTSSILKNVEIILSHYPKIKNAFCGIISGGDVEFGKPNPEVFLKGASLAQAHPSSAVVFEDAPLGIRAAKAGGMKAIGLTTTFSKKCLEEENPEAIFSDFSELSNEFLQSLFPC
ncbi:MAG: HAD family phosphatase [Chlamydia sp.]